MRLKLSFEIKEKRIESDNRRIFLSFFKSSLSENEKLELFYSNGRRKEFTFSIYFPNAKFRKDELKLSSNEFYLNFSISSMEEGIYFMNSFIKKIGKSYPLPKRNSFILKNIEIVEEKEVLSESVEFRTLSPIIVKERIEDENRDWYYTFEDERWEEVLKANMKEQLKEVFDLGDDIEKLKIKAVKPKRTIIRNYNISFPVSLGNLKIQGEKYLLDYFSKSGIGSKRAQGFGMLEVI